MYTFTFLCDEMQREEFPEMDNKDFFFEYLSLACVTGRII